MSLRWRLIGGIALLFSVLWAATALWFFIDIRGELRDVLDARLASSARMVQNLVARAEPYGLGEPLLPPTASARRGARSDDGILSLPSELTCQLWTLEGRLVSAARGAPRLDPSSIPDGFSDRDAGGESWRVFALSDASSGLRILTAERLGPRRALISDVAAAVSAPYVLVLPATVLLIFFAVGRALTPLDRVSRSIRARDADALDPIPEGDAPPEVAPLLHALNGLLARLADAFERERRFTGDAAHELRTPLAGIKTQLQIAREADGAVRERALAQAESGIDRMSALVTQMLWLARVEAPSAAWAEPGTRVAAVAAAVLRELEPAAAARGLRLELDASVDGLDVPTPIPGAMLHTALRNLVQNAIEHSPSSGRVVVEARRLRRGVLVQVLDEGPGLPPDELGKVTRRFYRSGTGNANGTGLGLAIVAAIARRYGAELWLRNREDRPGLAAGLAISVEAQR